MRQFLWTNPPQCLFQTVGEFKKKKKKKDMLEAQTSMMGAESQI